MIDNLSGMSIITISSASNRAGIPRTVSDTENACKIKSLFKLSKLFQVFDFTIRRTISCKSSINKNDIWYFKT